MVKKKKFLRWFNNQKLGKKILYTFILASVIPLLVAQVLMLYVISNNMKEKVDDLMVSQLMQISERTSLTLDVYTSLVYQIYSDNRIIDELKEYEMVAPENMAGAYSEICNQIQQYGNSASGIECISIILPDGRDITYDFGMASAVDNLWDIYENMTSIEPYTEAQDATNMVISPTARFLRGTRESRIFHISKQMYDFENIQEGPIATIVMSINESVLNKVCKTSQGEDEKETYTINFITDREGNVLTYPDSFYAGIMINKNRTIEEFVEITGELKGRNIAINRYEDVQLDWNFYNVYDRDYILRDVRKIQYLTIFIGMLLFLISVFLIRYTVKLIEKSTRSIVGGIQQVQKGNLDVQVIVESEDEMGQIADNFNTMTEKVQGLITEVTEVTQKQKEAEIRALEAQINPHFLYNTLDSINWMAIEKQEYEISKMLRNLGVILRYSVNKSNKLVTVHAVTDWLEKYISLQQMRFNDAFSSEIHADQGAEKVLLHKLLIQPFVENAIVHGFKGVESGGILRIDFMVSESGEELDIIIEDNGKGMPLEVAENFNDPVRAVQDDGRSIGLHNAFARMRMYYGERVSWNVKSIPNVGTIITLKIPVQNKENMEK
ncbi:cache domain-containing sensor histidine kinase [Faecalicatena contorta]|uniref:Two-component system, sensor histidine kinase YesM n=1 Tax=Faecalicatena contorta TaxID=39482 RepID=A0A315ZXS9_9FIRM|nr:histidine kinase [Faecalicatena contorta]PWJ50461.1 two-component system sensor histidine kinase YesM [Faecalicatena contorta]SUQ13869.1 two-component system, sensor histidine kinase YesM [Faecalicatena contorta]